MNATPDEEIGSRLQQVREDLGLNQSQLISRLKSAGLGWSQATISKVEAGARPVRVAELPALAAALSVSQQDLLAPEDPIKATLDRITLIEATAYESYASLQSRYVSAKAARRGVQLLFELSKGFAGPYTVSCSSARFVAMGLQDEYSDTQLPIAEAFSSLGIQVVPTSMPALEGPEDIYRINESLPADYQFDLDWEQVTQLRDSLRDEERDLVAQRLVSTLGAAALGRSLEERFPQVEFIIASDRTNSSAIRITGLENDDA